MNFSGDHSGNDSPVPNQEWAQVCSSFSPADKMAEVGRQEEIEPRLTPRLNKSQT